MLRAILGTIVLIFFAWAAGLRIHWQEILKRFEQRGQRVYQLIDLNDGRNLVGHMLERGEGIVTIETGGAAMTFGESEIRNVTDRTVDQLIEDGYEDWLVFEVPGPIVTFGSEDGLFYRMLNKGGGSSNRNNRKRGSTSFFSDVTSSIRTARHVRESVEKMQRSKIEPKGY